MTKAKARKISEMKQLDMIRKHTDRLIRGSHSKEDIEQYIDQDVPNLDQRVKLKRDIFTAHAEHLDHILNKIKAINAGKEKMSFSASSNRLIDVYPHAKVISKHPLKLETEYKPHRSYFIDDAELFDRFLEVQELEEMREMFNSKDMDQRDQVYTYWRDLKEQGYTLVEIGDLFYTTDTTIDVGIKRLKDQGIKWKYFN